MDDLSRNALPTEKLPVASEKRDRSMAVRAPSPMLTLLIMLIMALLLCVLFGKVTIETPPVSEVFPIYAQAGGMVTEVIAEDGQTVAEGQVLLRFTGEAPTREMRELQQRIGKVAAVTLTSTSDEGTADNRELIDIKSQYALLRADLTAAQAGFEQKQNALSTQKAEVTRLQSLMESAKAAYHNALGGSEGAAIQLEYQEAEKAYSQAQAAFEQVRLSYEPMLGTLATLETEYLKKIDDFMAANPTVVRVPVEVISPDDLVARAQNPNGGPLLPGDPVFTSPSFVELKTAWPDVAAAQASVAEKKISYDLAQATLSSSTARLETARNAHVQLSKQQEAKGAEAQRLSSNYQAALANYQNALNMQTTLTYEVGDLKQQVETEKARVAQQEAALDIQFAAAKEAVLSQLESELAMYELSTEVLDVVAGHSGVVAGLQAKPGDTVTAGSELANIEQSNTTVYHISLMNSTTSFWLIIAILAVAVLSNVLTIVLARRKHNAE